MYAQEEIFKKSADLALYASTGMCAAGLATGILFSSSVCGPDLSEWNIVNGVLCGALASSAHFGVNVNPRVLQNGFRILKGDVNRQDLMAEGMLSASVSIGLAALPALLLFWAVKGLSGMGIGICAESSPLFYGISLGEMIAQIAGILYVAKMNFEAAGYNVERIQSSIQDCAVKTKDAAVDLSRNGYTYAIRASDMAMPTIKATTEWTMEKGRDVWATKSKYFTLGFWTGPEGQSLLRY